MQLYVTELYRVIKILMDATIRAHNKGEKIILASLEYKARKYKEQIGQRLAVRN